MSNITIKVPLPKGALCKSCGREGISVEQVNTDEGITLMFACSNCDTRAVEKIRVSNEQRAEFANLFT
jgi:hypothetical protein